MGSGKSYNTSHEAAFSPLRSTLTSGAITPQADDTLQERRCRFKREKGHLTSFNSKSYARFTGECSFGYI